MWLFDLLFSSIPKILYNEVWISWSVSESPLDFGITRVDCMFLISPWKHLSYTLEVPCESASNKYVQFMFSWWNKKINTFFFFKCCTWNYVLLIWRNKLTKSNWKTVLVGKVSKINKIIFIVIFFHNLLNLLR